MVSTTRHSQRSLPLRSSNSTSHHATIHDSFQQLAVPSDLMSNGKTDRTLSSRNDSTVPPNIRVSPHWLVDQDVVRALEAQGSPSGVSLDGRSSITDHRTSVGHSSVESHRLDTWSSGSAISPQQTPHPSLMSHNDRRASFGASSVRYDRRVKWSSGPVRSQHPNPVDPSVICSCAPRSDHQRLQERLVLSASDVEMSIHVNQPTIEMMDCGLRQNMLHVYESYSRQSNGKYRVWLKTRRLVISQGHHSAARQQCFSFWLPLTDITSAVDGKALTLKWSDCNQWRASPLRNNKQSCDCIYNPDSLNNEIVVSFPDTEITIAFLSNLCAVYNDYNGVEEWRNVEIVDRQRLLAVDIRDQTKIEYRIACLATYRSNLYSTFQVFLHWPDLDLHIRIELDEEKNERSMVLRFDSVSTPNYTSNVVNEPWIDKSKVAQCVASDLVLGAYSMVFPFESTSPCRIPEGK